MKQSYTVRTAHLRNDIINQHSLHISYTLSLALCLGCCTNILCKPRDCHKNCHGVPLCRYSELLIPVHFTSGLGAKHMPSPRWNLHTDFTKDYKALEETNLTITKFRATPGGHQRKKKKKNQEPIHKHGLSHWSLGTHLGIHRLLTLLLFTQILVKGQDWKTEWEYHQYETSEIADTNSNRAICFPTEFCLELSPFMVKITQNVKSPFSINMYYISCV